MHLSTERDGPVAIVRFGRGKGNALSGAFLNDLRAEVARHRDDPATTCLVLGSTDERFFSVGMDLVEMEGGDPDAASRTLRSFCALYHELFLFPKPVLAAVTGHALAGGAILALTADLRVGRQADWRIGVTEIELGVPVPPGVYEMLVHAAGAAAARRIAFLGETFDPATALALGLLDSVEPPDRFESAWRALARALAGKPAEAYRQQKMLARRAAADAMVDKPAMQGFLGCWFGEPARTRRREVLAKLQAKRKD